MLEVFLPQTPLWEIIARGTAAYLIVALMIRFTPKRQAGDVSPNDLLALVIVGALTADAILGDANTVLDAILMIVIVLLWDYVFNLIEYYVPWFRRIAQDSPTLLIHDGEVLEANMRKEKLTEEELAAHLRLQGIADIGQVRQAVLEVDGKISVIRKDNP